MLTRNGWRNTTLAQIAGEAGVSPAGLLHHFESKEQLLNAVLDVRDADDDYHADRAGDLISEIAAVAERFYRSPELVGTYAVLLAENVHPDAPLHDRLRARYHDAVDIIGELIRRGQRSRPVSDGPGRHRQVSADPRLHHRNGDDMVAQPFDTTDRGLQGVRGIVGQGHGTTEPGVRYRLDVVAATSSTSCGSPAVGCSTGRWPAGT